MICVFTGKYYISVPSFYVILGRHRRMYVRTYVSMYVLEPAHTQLLYH
jgi:hypothetical protein